MALTKLLLVSTLLTVLSPSSSSLFATAKLDLGPHLGARYYADPIAPVGKRHHHKRSSRTRSKRAYKCNPKNTSSSSANKATIAVSAGTGVVRANTTITASGNATLSSSRKSRTSLYNWTDTSTTMYGVNLGSWLMLEKWMVPDLFSQYAPNAVDDYTFEQALGNKAASVLKENHWDTYVSLEDVQDLAAAGVNMIRIPFGYWAFHESVGGDPFAALAGQQDQITRVLGYVAKYKMHAILDLHSAVGRASEDQCNGRLNGPVNFYDDDMQSYNDAVFQAIYKFAIQSPYRNNIAGIALVNEPDVCMSSYNQQRIDAIGGYYQRAYTYTTSQSDPIPIIMHHGYCGLPQWNNLVSKMDPNYAIMEDHPYPGTFASTDSESDALGGVCDKVQQYVTYPIPVVLTEVTLYFKVGQGDSSFVQQMYQQQVSAFALTGGSAFWSFKGANNADNGWNFLQQVKDGVIPTPAKGQSIKDFVTGFTNDCGITQSPPWAA